MQRVWNATPGERFAGMQCDPEHDGSAAKNRPEARLQCRRQPFESARRSAESHDRSAANATGQFVRSRFVAVRPRRRSGWWIPARHCAPLDAPGPMQRWVLARDQPPARGALPMVVTRLGPRGTCPTTKATRPVERPPMPLAMRSVHLDRARRTPLFRKLKRTVQARQYRPC